MVKWRSGILNKSDVSQMSDEYNAKLESDEFSEKASGYFSPENTYWNMIGSTDDPQTRHSIYEKSLNWEADRAALLEQRDYEDPQSQIARQRAAGINPDVIGNGSSGGVSSGSSATQGQTQGNTPFGSPLIDAQIANIESQTDATRMNTILAPINTAASFISGVSGGVSGIMNAVTQMRLQPSQSQLNKSQAALADAQAGEINELLAGKKASQGISNAQAFTSLISSVAKQVNPDSTDEDINSLFSSAGVSADSLPQYLSALRAYQKNPNVLSDFYSGQTRAKWSKAENAFYTDAICAEMTELGHKVNYEHQYFDFYSSNLKRQISQLFNTGENVERSVTEMELSLSNSIESQDLQLKAIRFDTQAFLSNLQNRADVLKDNRSRYEALSKMPETPERVALMERLEAENIALRGLYSNQFSEIKSSFLNGARLMFENNYRLDTSGNINSTLSSLEKYIQFSDSVFNDLYFHNKSPEQIANEWIQGISGAFRDIGIGVGGFKSTKVRIAKP